ncbi:unnamed protein product [Effrenium voratum]|uniref:Secreted protein n=1 Tax=Effrenium voratum TaxID=2562239 RepID=A0AA36IB27_9DINO|nr:unnamed protein product [Effrenium voratum]
MPWRFKSCSFLTVAKWTTASFFSVCRQLLARPLQSNARSKNWLSLARADLRRRNSSACAGLTACVVSSHSVTVRAPPFQLPGLHAKATNVSEVANDISRLSHSQSERLHAQLLCASGLLGAQGGRPAVWEAAKDARSFSRCASCKSRQMELV